MENTNTPSSMKNRVHENVILAGRARHWSFKPRRGKSKIVRPGDAKWINL